MNRSSNASFPRSPLSLAVICCLLFIGCIALLPACTPTPTASPRATSISCHTAYRSSPNIAIEHEDSIIFDDSDERRAAPYADLTFHAQYSSGEMNRERTLRLWVTEAGQTAELFSQLYQLPQNSGPQNQFIGGHGFTGLNYTHHPTTEAELQYWCNAS